MASASNLSFLAWSESRSLRLPVSTPEAQSDSIALSQIPSQLAAAGGPPIDVSLLRETQPDARMRETN
jgi:hypothetical protein